ncbi:MAG TPA: glutamine amidotransferase, partial [Phycisphaerales bacterium]|nr:glutamine amidotransferase [Phycisphaerales bacterium]
GHRWVHPLSPVGDGTAIKRAINALTFGDMQDFTPSFQLSLNSLKDADAGQKHMIVISDGDPSMPPVSLLQEFKDNGITCSTVEVFPHSGADSSRMEEIARLTGGRHYFVNTQAGLAKLPEIFMKEAMTVRRSLIWESGKGVTPSLLPGASSTLRGVTSVPVINGYVVTAEREGLALTTAKVIGADPDQGDPLLAQWQYGLGRVVAYTSDASTKWNASWVGWQGYRQFWEQHVRWTMRPQGSANVRVLTETKGDNTLVTIEALDTKGERLSFANFRGRLAKPDGTGEGVEFTQVAPGRYQATVPTELSGSYVLSARYAASDANVAGGVLEGAVQAAISRPFADEYRVLRDNTALLTQIAELTGGRVLTGDPRVDALWDRTALEMPVAKTPIWLTVAIIGLILFVLDVGVRRVRLDAQMVLNVFRRAFGKSAVATGNVGGLKAAREQARAKIQARAASGGTQLSSEQLAKQAKEEAQRAVSTAGRKFEATTEQLKGASGNIAMGGADAKPQKIEEKARPVDQPQQPGEGMSRLMQAKKKAREGMEDE